MTPIKIDVPNCKRCVHEKGCLYPYVMKHTPGADEDVPLCYMYERAKEEKSVKEKKK